MQSLYNYIWINVVTFGGHVNIDCASTKMFLRYEKVTKKMFIENLHVAIHFLHGIDSLINLTHTNNRCNTSLATLCVLLDSKTTGVVQMNT